MNLLTKLFGSYSKKELKRIEPLKQAVLALDDKYTKMTDEELKGQTVVLKERLSLGSSLDDILPKRLQRAAKLCGACSPSSRSRYRLSAASFCIRVASPR